MCKTGSSGKPETILDGTQLTMQAMLCSELEEGQELGKHTGPLVEPQGLVLHVPMVRESNLAGSRSDVGYEQVTPRRIIDS